MNDKPINHVIFDIGNPPFSCEVRKISTRVFFDKNNTMCDTRMGAFKNIPCGTCGGNEATCPGHFGFINLTYPVVNPLFVNSVLRPVLKALCLTCNNLACTCQKRKRHGNGISIGRYDGYSSQNRGLKMCFVHNGNIVPIQTLYEYISSIPDDQTKVLFPHFDGRKVEDLVFIKKLAVLPLCSRPPNLSNGSWLPNSMSLMYIEVLKASKELQHNINAQMNSYIIVELHNELQNAVNVLLDKNNTNKELTGIMYNQGGIRNRIDGKFGRMRNNIMGKRTDFSARTVLSGDPNLGVDQIGIPPSIAQTLTIPERVTSLNINKIDMSQVKFVIKNGQRYDLSFKRDVQVCVGDVVERQLRNNDVVAINRQPTLHRGSMMACRVKIINCSTFRLNYSTMIPLNADCDGDEINVFVPQDLESKAELENIMLSTLSIVNSQSSKPIIALSQDSLLGCFLLSISFIDEILMNDILMALDLYHLDFTPTILKPRRLFTGKDVIKLIIEHIVGNDTIDIDMLTSIDKSNLGAGNRSLIHIVYLEHGPETAGVFIHALQKAANMFLTHHGFSIGIGDCLDTNENFNWSGLDLLLASQGKADEKELIDAIQNLLFLDEDTKENFHNNSLLTMIKSGSKGSIINYNQIKRCVGQQIDNGKRIPKEISNYKRTLPHFKNNDTTTSSRGLVKNSFIKGLTPYEFFFHAKSSRISLIDTACKTSETGYLQRQMIKNVENIIVSYDGTVRDNISGMVIQFKYAGDGLDTTYKA